MKYRINTVLTMIIALSLPVSVHANEPAAPSQKHNLIYVSPTPVHENEPVASSRPAQQKSMDEMPCPMMKNMGSMQKDMGNMIGDMNNMMQMTSDPAMKERMQKMHENMGAMMQQMMDMQKGMGGMMQGGKIDGKRAKKTPASVTPEDHKAHHPDKP